MSTYADRPPADPAKLLALWGDWEAGDEMPGQAVANLKKGGLPDVLTASVEATHDEVTAALLTTWDEWERGRTGPREVLDRLAEGGLKALLESTVAAQQEAFGTTA